MKVLGIGVDIIENSRIKSLLKKKLFIKKIYGKNEIKFSKNINNKTNYFAKRFAAKEAFAKAIGTGIRKNLNFKDIEILNNKTGKPYYFISSKIKSIIKKKFHINKFDLFVSISDEKKYSIAFTILRAQ